MKVIDLEQYAVMDAEVKSYFPHPSMRKYQASLANNIYRSLIEGANIVVECPTGLGKALDGEGSFHPPLLGLFRTCPYSPLHSRAPDRHRRSSRERWHTRLRMI